MPTFGTFTDSRDGHVYTTVLMPDGNWWSVEDLVWAGSGDTGDYGRLYTYNQAVTACPSGTHLPTATEINTMIASVGGISTAGTALKSATSWAAYSGVPTGTNQYGLNIKPSGWKASAGTKIQLSGLKSYWWSSTSVNGTNADRFSVSYNSEATLTPSDVKSDLYAVHFIVDSGNIPDTCATPVATPEAGTYTSAQSVALASATPGASIYYTLDGSDPTLSTLYTEPLDISTSTTVKAVAVKAGLDDSAILTANYLINPTGTFPILTPCTLQMLCDSKVANSSSGRRRTVSRDSSFVFSATLNLPSECEQFESVPYYNFPVIGDCEIRQLDLVKYTFRDTEKTSSVKCVIVPNIMQKRTGDFRISCEPNISMDEAMLVATGSSSLEVLSSSRSLSLKCVWTVSFLAATQFIEWLRGSVNRIFTTSVGGMKGVACQIGDSVSLEIGSTDVKISADLAIVNTKQFPLNVTASRVGNVVTVSTGTAYTGTLVNRSGEIVEVVTTATNVLTFTTYPENCYLLIREGNNVTEWLEL